MCFITVCTLLVLTAAGAIAIEPKDVVGTWRSSFGAVSEFHKDFTYDSHFADEYGSGKWELGSGNVLRMSSYAWYWKRVFSEDCKIVSLKDGIMRLKTSEGLEVWFRQKQKIRWPKEVEKNRRQILEKIRRKEM